MNEKNAVLIHKGKSGILRREKNFDGKNTISVMEQARDQDFSSATRN